MHVNISKTRALFLDATLKLTAIYLAIIMVISLLFSIGLYRVSTQEIERSIRRDSPLSRVVRTRNLELVNELIEEQEEAIAEAHARVRSSLVLINLSLLVAGGIVSYVLARRTLTPIEEAHEAQSRFTSDASHELRTPITAMRAETELTLTDDKLTLTKAKQQLQSNIEELDKLTELSEGLLQLAKIDEHGIEKSSASLKQVVEQARENVLQKSSKKQQTINVADFSNIHIHANYASIVQLVTILLDNAVKYSPETSKISVAVSKRKANAVITVADKGVGIKAREIPHIFDRFYRADSSRTKTDGDGYGIGLSLAKAITDLHGGTISVKSTPQKGSTFTITLPL